MNSFAGWLLSVMGIVRRRRHARTDEDSASADTFEQFLEEMRVQNLRSSSESAERIRKADRDAA